MKNTTNKTVSKPAGAGLRSDEPVLGKSLREKAVKRPLFLYTLSKLLFFIRLFRGFCRFAARRRLDFNPVKSGGGENPLLGFMTVGEPCGIYRFVFRIDGKHYHFGTV
jgi:hypothetical protein